VNIKEIQAKENWEKIPKNHPSAFPLLANSPQVSSYGQLPFSLGLIANK
jgi:hypothetical protein